MTPYRRGIAVSTPTTALTLAFVLSAALGTGVYMSTNADSPCRPELAPSASALGSLALTEATRDLFAGGSGNLDRESSHAAGWHTQATDYGEVVVIRATATARGRTIEREATYVKTDVGLELVR